MNKEFEYQLNRIRVKYTRFDDEQWITMCGSHVLVGEDGELKGAVGKAFFDRKGSARYVGKSSAPKVDLTLDKMPKVFSKNKSEVKSTQIALDALKNPNIGDKNLVAMYARICNDSKLDELKISHPGKCNEYRFSTHYYLSSGKIIDLTLYVPKLDDDSSPERVQQYLHELAHLADFSGRENVDKAGSFTEQSASLMFAVTNGVPKISDDTKQAFTEWKKEADEIDKKYTELFEEFHQGLKEKYLNENGVFSSMADYKAYSREFNKGVTAINNEQDQKNREINGGGYAALADMYLAMGVKTDCNYGHEDKYYASASNRASEIFAQYCSLSVTHPELVKVFEKDYPDVVKACRETVKELANGGGK